MTKRKANADIEDSKSRKRRPFRVARDAATKAKSVQSHVRRSAPLEADYHFRIKHNAEASSLLRLPLEVRSLIYRELLGDRVIHIGHFNRSITERSDYSYQRLTTKCSRCGVDASYYDDPRWFHNVCRKPESVAGDYNTFQSGDRTAEYSR